MDNKRKRHALILLGLLFILSVLIALVIDRNNYYTRSNSVISLNDINDEVIDVSNLGKVFELRQKYNNDEIVGNISIEGTNISEAILKHSDNDYYLHHDNYGNYEINGSIFLDYRISLDDRKVLIFGHSSVYDKIPFNELERYYDYDYYKNHQYIKITTLDGEYIYQIFSVYVETYDFTYMNLKIDDKTYNKNLRDYKNNSIYDTGVSVSDNDEIIILQTCSNDNKYKNYKKKYLLVIGKKIFKEG